MGDKEMLLMSNQPDAIKPASITADKASAPAIGVLNLHVPAPMDHRSQKQAARMLGDVVVRARVR